MMCGDIAKQDDNESDSRCGMTRRARRNHNKGKKKKIETKNVYTVKKCIQTRALYKGHWKFT